MNKEVHDCLLCGAPLLRQISWLMLIERFPSVMCESCERKFVQNDKIDEGHMSLYQYNEAMKDYLHRYKFMQDIVLAKVFRQPLQQLFKKQKSIIVPIPMHPERRRERTFSHIEVMLEQARVPYVDLLEKLTTEQQSKKTRQQRLQTAPLFKVINSVEAQHYVLFDDIYTTGTTLAHAKVALLEAGAKSVSSVTLIRG